ncbi:MAG: hypothetical protein HY267_08170 [Deltaproteobacteria bacterium]|nr:hypothetical protein [Deltaproteobacteria bacterium]
MADDTDVLWGGQDSDGVQCQISRRQWQEHVAKRPEIEAALELTKTAMAAAESAEPDKHRPADEERRYFRLLRISGQERWARHLLVVSVKCVRQSDDRWIKFYQSCWYERKRGNV